MPIESSFYPKCKTRDKLMWISAVLLPVLLTVFAAGLPAISEAASSKQKYYIAERCYLRLKKDASLQKYRDQWLSCIGKFQEVYKNDPRDSWASAGLYMSGELYSELFRLSGKLSDKKEAVDIFERVVKRYPSSDYRIKALAELKKLAPERKTATPEKNVAIPERRIDTPAKKPEAFAKKPEASEKVAEASEKQHKFKKSMKMQTRVFSPGVANSSGFQHPETVVRISARPENASSRISNFTGIPKNVVTGLRYWSNPNYTRVVIDADGETDFIDNLLKPDPALHTPRRLYVDVANARLGRNMETIVPINDDLLKDARAGQYQPDTVRVVVDIKTFSTYKIFPLNNPFRIVIDVWGEKQQLASSSPEVPTTPIPGNEKVGPGDLARQLALGVRRIVLDPGHGGKDFGAPGHMKGVHEKYVVLDIARKLKKMIEKELGCEVFLTRDSDRFLALEERTAIANTRNADLFISIHTNAHKDSNANGIETYYLNLATDDEAIRVAAMENATSKKNISDLQAILNDLMQNAKIQESTKLASFVQNSLYGQIRAFYKPVRNKGVKQAPFYVLLGAQMPAVLVETGFISNPVECKRLIDPAYQDHVCRAIVNGIRDYIKATTPTAILTSSP